MALASGTKLGAPSPGTRFDLRRTNDRVSHVEAGASETSAGHRSVGEIRSLDYEGMMFEFCRNKFVGSYFFFRIAKRS
jgi:hypothetical protein